MTDQWQYQLRLTLDEASANLARRDPDDPAIETLSEILGRHRATLKCQYDAFSDYVTEAEKQGVEEFPLYEWTKETIEDPVKKAKYLTSFTLYVDGDEVYAKEKADALESDLLPLVGGKPITAMSKYDTNPANNPQPPKRDRG